MRIRIACLIVPVVFVLYILPGAKSTCFPEGTRLERRQHDLPAIFWGGATFLEFVISIVWYFHAACALAGINGHATDLADMAFTYCCVYLVHVGDDVLEKKYSGF